MSETEELIELARRVREEAKNEDADGAAAKEFEARLQGGKSRQVLEMLLAPEADQGREAAVASVVVSVDGLRDEAGEPCKWTQGLGVECLNNNPEAADWLEEQADLVEADFQKYLEAARGNSVPSSASSTVAAGGEIPS